MDEDLKKHVLKTGTTTLGIVCRDGIVIAADRKVSYGAGDGVAYVAGDITKVVPVNDDIIVTMAGGASDSVKVIRMIKSELKLKQLRVRKKPTIREAANLFATVAFQNIRNPSVIVPITHFVLAGKDGKEFHLYDIAPDGHLKKMEDYIATGSGMMHINPILDQEYEKGLSINEGIELARKCIRGSSKRDPASGEGIDIYVVKKDSIEPFERKKGVLEYKDE